MKKKQFDTLYKGKAVHCKTEELAKEFLKLAHSFGYKWHGGSNGSLLRKDDIYKIYKEKTCYSVNIYFEYCDIDWYKENGYKVIEFKSPKDTFKKPETNEEKVAYLVRGFGTGYGNIDLSGINFGNIQIFLSHIKAYAIYNNNQKAHTIINGYQEAQHISNDYQKILPDYEAMSKEELINEIKKLKGE